MASTMRFDNWQTTDGTSIATTNASGDITFAGALAANSISGGGKILQVVHAVQTSEFASSATSFVDVTGSSASITPSSASSKVLVLVHGSLSLPGDVIVDFTIFRGNAATGTNLGHSSFGFGRPRISDPGAILIVSAATLDSPATTSSVTYQLAMKCQIAATFYYGTSGSHATVTLMEVAA